MSRDADRDSLVAALGAEYGIGPHFIGAFFDALPGLFPRLAPGEYEGLASASSLDALRDRAGGQWRSMEYSLTCNRRAANLIGRVEAATALPRKGRFLDVGCAYGGLLRLMHARDYDVYGVELNSRFAALGAANLSDVGLSDRIRNGDLFDELPHMGRFDVITCNDVIEHVLDPTRAIELMSSILNPGGILIIFAPNGRAISNALSDPHYALFAASLMPRSLAYHYVTRCLNTAGYSMGDYYSREWLLSRMEGAALKARAVGKDTGVRPEAVPHLLSELLNKLPDSSQALDPIMRGEVRRIVFEYVRDVSSAMLDLEAGDITMDAFFTEYLAPAWTVVGVRPS